MRNTWFKYYVLMASFCLLGLGCVTHVFASSESENHYLEARDYARGINGVEQNLDKAKELYLMAAEAGHVLSQDIVGQSYLEGTNGFPKDKELALPWIQKAAGAGNGRAMANLIYCHIEKIGGLKKNKKKITELHEKVIQNDRKGEAIFRLAEVYHLTAVLKFKNKYKFKKEEIQKLYLMAGEKGNADIQWGLAFLYDNKLWFESFFPLDSSQAISWAKKSAHQGNTQAIDYLKKYYNVTVFEGDGSGALPETITCPRTFYKLLKQSNGLESGMVVYSERGGPIYGETECLYEDGISVRPGWTIYDDPLSEDAQSSCKRRTGTGYYKKTEPTVYAYDDDKKRAVTVRSEKALTSVYMNLSKKEFKKENRQKWIDLAMPLLLIGEKRGTSCVKEQQKRAPKSSNDVPKAGSVSKPNNKGVGGRPKSKSRGPRAIMK